MVRPRPPHRSLALAVALLAAAACSSRAEPLGEVPVPVAEAVEPLSPLVVAHGGQGSPASRSDGPAAAAKAVLSQLESGAAPMEAAIAGVVLLEDDPRFNAGTGANYRLDGRTIETDAAIMDDRGRFGAVAGLSGIENPILVARAVADSPHTLLAGEGARAFAHTLGLADADLGTPQARSRLQHGWSRLLAGERWARFDWRARWNFETPAPTNMGEASRLGSAASDVVEPGPEAADAAQDTIGVVLRSADGHYAAALSTGGTTLALRGRVGDVPQLGAGLFAGPAGAVATTGHGEAITREQVAARVYALLEQGLHPREAIRRGARGVTPAEGLGVIAVSELGYGAWATSQMAWAAADPGQTVRADAVITR